MLTLSVGTFRARAVERQRRKVPAISILPTAASARDSATGQRGKGVVHRQTLESAPGGNQRRQIPQAALVLLARGEDHFRIKFSGGSFRLQHHFLRLRRETHELGADNVAAARQPGKRVGSICSGRYREFLSGQGIGRGDGYARQRGFSGFHNTANFK